MKSLLEAIKVIKSGNKLCIFVEGTRNKSGTNQLQEIKGGSMIFAVKAKCPIVPMMLNGKAKPFRKTHLIIGEPFELSDFYGKKLNNDDMEEMAKIVTNKMLEQQNKLNEILNKKKRTKKK
jgi:1-acyl-sn-glycerol-3-phosphate acyltransferase